MNLGFTESLVVFSCNLDLYALPRHHIRTLYCRSPHISIYLLLCVLQHYKLCPATLNNDLPGMNKMLISEKDRLY